MVRVKRGVVARQRHKHVLKLAKGYYSARSRTFRCAKQAVIKAGQYAYRDRRKKRSIFRFLWIKLLNTRACSIGFSYNEFIHYLKKSGILLDRKILSSVKLINSNSFSILANILKLEKEKDVQRGKL